MTDEFTAYLEAKQSVDDRALHRPTFDCVVRALAERATARGDEPVRILEVGFGIGTMLERLIEWNAVPNFVEYAGVDINKKAIVAAQDRLTEQGFTREDGQLRYDGVEGHITLQCHAMDAFEFASEHQQEAVTQGEQAEPQFDLLIGMAFLDVVELDEAIETLLPLIAGGGYGYFPITFDGETIFRPADEADSEVIPAFHAAMDTPDRAGGSQTGRQLFDRLPAAGGKLLSAGGSDWVVTPTDEGYPGEEAEFLHHIISTIEKAVLTETPEAARPAESTVREWAERRRDQISAGDLSYVAHGYDHLIRMP